MWKGAGFEGWPNLWKRGSRGRCKKAEFWPTAVMFKSTCPFLQAQTGNVTSQWIYLLLCLWSPVTGVGCLPESSAPDVLSIIADCVLLLRKGDSFTGSCTVLRSSPPFPCAFLTASSSQSHWYDSPNTLTWPLREKLTLSWTWHRRDGLVFLHTLTNVSHLCDASKQCFFLKGISKSFGDARKPDGKLSSSWAGARGLHAEM